jgi:hypothetical protein
MSREEGKTQEKKGLLMDGEDVRRLRNAMDKSQRWLVNRIRSRGHKRPLCLRALQYIEAKGKSARITARIEAQLNEVLFHMEQFAQE